MFKTSVPFIEQYYSKEVSAFKGESAMQRLPNVPT